MNLLCKWFGHRTLGYVGRPPYMTILGGAVDGTNTQHCRLEMKCDRCQSFYIAGYLHMPADFKPNKRFSKNAPDQ